METSHLAASPIMQQLTTSSLQASESINNNNTTNTSIKQFATPSLKKSEEETLFNEFNEKSTIITTDNHKNPMNATPTTEAVFILPASSSSADSISSPAASSTVKTKKKSMKKKQSDQIFMNQSVIYNHEGKKQRNKTIYSINHPKVSEQLGNFQFQVGQEVKVNVCECKSEKKTERFDKIIIEHLGYTNQHNMDASKTIAIEFVNVLAFKRRRNDSKILWIYESVVLELLNSQPSETMNESPVLKRKLDSMSESDQSSTSNCSTIQNSNLDEFDNCFLEVAANPFVDSSSLFSPNTAEEQTKRSKIDSKIENLYLESIEPEDAPSKKSTLFQLSLDLNIEQPYHLFNPMMRHFCLDFVSLTEEQLAFDATIISVQPIITNVASLKGKKFELIGKTPIISMYDSVNTFVRLCVDTQIFICKNSTEEKLFFYFYGEDKRMKSEQIIQNPNVYSKKSDMENYHSSNSSNQKDSSFADLILFDFGAEDNFLFEQFKNVNLESKKSRNLLYDRYLEFSKEIDGNCEEAIKSLVHIQDALGFTLLMHFAARNMLDEARACIYWGANISQKDSFGNDALFWSKHFKAKNVTELLTEIISEIDQTRGDRSDEIAFQEQIRFGLVNASSRLEKRQGKTFKENNTDFSSDEENATILK